jgi:rhodanese-related sulfurtransferase
MVYCDTGRRGAAAAFLLTQRGLTWQFWKGDSMKMCPATTLTKQ